MRYRFLRFPEGKFKAVTFSYDDGLHSDIRLARRLSDAGMKGTFNISTGLLSESPNSHYLSADEIKENIIPLGHELAIHGHTHRAPGLSRPMEVIDEFLTCRKNMESLFGGIVRGMAYPDSGLKLLLHGNDREEIKLILRSLDIAYARTTNDDRSFSLPNDWLEWPATAHHTDPGLMPLIDEFLRFDEKKLYASRRYPKLLYIWGHSAEFDDQNNWSLLDEICEKISGRNDIWYATNMEIYEYSKSYESLIFSTDGNIVYNPTLQTVWFDQDGKLYAVKSGESLIIK